MFDQDSANLIRNTPDLDGLDRNALPEFLTNAFAQIAAARVRMRELNDDSLDSLNEIISPIRRLAFTNEALVSALPERADRRSAAFVAATAHQLRFNADYLLQQRIPKSSIGPFSISSDVAAVLLFLIAEATADASEIARSLDLRGLDPVALSLISSICDLANGDLQKLLNRELPSIEETLFEDLSDYAVKALYFNLLQGVRKLASEILSGWQDEENGTSLDSFIAVRDMSLGDSVDFPDFGNATPTSSFSGPHHLASLLISVSRDLFNSAVTNVSTPPSINPVEWLDSMQFTAKSRPYLWQNHQDAIEKGYLNPGTSSVIGFPTGAGKSTLAELKIRVTLLQDRSVIFLCPTHALVQQTVNSLKNSFSNTSVQGERQDLFGFGFGEFGVAEIFVMTPEACLAQLSIEPDVFENIGLLVFDECHLLHPNDNPNDRRAIDSMLCLINLPLIATDLDLLLLSAMMKNTDELAEWISELTAKPCLSLSLSWKPTRQLRGSVVYQQQDVNELNNLLRKSRREGTTRAPSARVKRNLKIKPYALFGLKQTWNTTKSQDYSLIPLLGDEIELGANTYWKITPNSGVVSSSITNAAVNNGMRTLVFFQTITNAASAAKKISHRLKQPPVRLTPTERRWADISTLELGGNSRMYVQVQDGLVSDSALVHHGLLLPEERSLCESLYKRPDGIKALTATSTLAQGMNLPSELVIIAEDSRFDSATERREILEAQELLNAAGRAGRAGESASGIVLVIPGKVVGIDLGDGKIGHHWGSLREIFGQSDQCLVIDDPLTRILDRVQSGQNTTKIDQYTIARLAQGENQEARGNSLSQAIRRSLAAHKARKRNDEKWLDERVAASVRFFNEQSSDKEVDALSQQLAASLGLSTDLVTRLISSLDSNQYRIAPTIPAWRKWFFDWLEENPDMLEHVFRANSLSELLGRKYSEFNSSGESAKFAIPILRKLVRAWMKGAPLSELELILIGDPRRIKKCVGARRFVVRIIPELSFLFGFPALLHERRLSEAGIESLAPPAQAQLRYCLKQGFNSLEQAALSQILRNEGLSRRELHLRHQDLHPHIDIAMPGESWDNILDRVNKALQT
ncbi:DEAD/DEAH box helicase [Marinobacter sp. W-8]|uniref:DEAD/DEAH box helicase n=1 Tax=Marinobacter sp. W-8 TaxID=3369658 RepID=UPI0037CA57A0